MATSPEVKRPKVCPDYRFGFHPDPTERLVVSADAETRLNTKLSKSVPFGSRPVLRNSFRSVFETVLAVGRYPSLTRFEAGRGDRFVRSDRQRFVSVSVTVSLSMDPVCQRFWRW